MKLAIRKNLFTVTVAVSLVLLATRLFAQSCTFVSPTVQFVSITSNSSTGQCEYLVNLEFDIQVNGGNKYIFVHLWEQSKYHFGSGGTALPFAYATLPVDNAGSSSGILYSSLVNIGINSFDNPSTFYTNYPPDATVPMANASTMPGITVTETPLNGTTSRYLIENVKITLPGPCVGTLPTFTGDAWSTNGASANQVQCAMPGFTFGALGPIASGAVTCATPANLLSFTIAKDASSTAADVNIDVYVDRNGDGLFNIIDDAPAIDSDGDINYHLAGSNSPLTINNNTLYYPTSISADPILKNRNLFLVIKNIIITNSDGTTTIFNDAFVREINNSCSVLPIQFGEINARMKNSTLQVSWQSLRETNCKDYEIQVSSNATEWHTIGKVSSIALSGNSDIPLNYSFSGNSAVLGDYQLQYCYFLFSKTVWCVLASSYWL
ncbi:hypothetical protein [Niabella hibiscisoli]|uniref:hypothetical protein n=1 Tax=Niabella hibiscisoli TaxID=1825928 RepID=UPI001F115796|nr:hypothetical protein [Niabella hibiscisoli]MCH5716936.1 hypothetical protein [Niabella hibiscisoli]